MKKVLKLSILAVAAMTFAACGGAADNKPAANTANAANANAAKPATTAPSADALVALENKAYEAWKNKDGKFFDGFMTANFVSFDDHGKRPSRADMLKMITESKCEVKSFSLTDPHVTPAGASAAVLTVKATADYTCNGKAGPSPIISATVYVKDGDSWKAAYHNEVTISEPKAAKTDDKKAAAPPPPPAKKEAEKPAANTMANTAANANAAAKPAESLTASLTALEKSGWEAWKARDAKKLEEVTAKDLTFVDIFGKVTSGQADVVKGWTEGKCEVKSVDVTDTNGTSITADAAILTYKGHADGTCDGNPLQDLWGTTVSVKEGDAWKAVYIFETPMAK